MFAALTASNMEGNKEKALQVGCLGYITKPIDIHQFTQQVAVFLQGDKAEDPVCPIDSVIDRQIDAAPRASAWRYPRSSSRAIGVSVE